jgi:flagellar hook-associated protein 3 FlgL
MRVADNQRYHQYASELQQRLVNLQRLQQEVGTGHSLFAPSEGVQRADEALTSTAALAASAQLQRNTTDAQQWVDASDSKLQSIVDLIKSVDALALAADNSSQTEIDRQNTATQLNEKLNELMGLVNSTDGDRYLFGGFATTTAPFTATRDANGEIQSVSTNAETIAGAIYRRIGQNEDVQVNVSGAQLFQPVGAAGTDGDLFYVIASLRDTIANNNTPPAGDGDTRTNEHLREQLATIRDRITDQQTYLGSLGQRLEQTLSRLKDQDIRLTNRLETAQGTDITDVVSRVSAEQGAYNALASLGTRLLNLSIVDYLS